MCRVLRLLTAQQGCGAHWSILLLKQLHHQHLMPRKLTCVVDDCNLLGPQQLLRDRQGTDHILRHTAA